MIVIFLFLSLVFLIVGLRHLENKMIFFPMAFPEGYWDTSGFPGQLDDCTFQTEDGVRLHGWFARAAEPQNNSSAPTLLFFHGNAGNITHRLPNIASLVQLGIQVFIFDYRGYGKSQGRPTEQGVYADAIAAYDYLLSRNDIDKNRIVFFGRSLGGAVAVELATRRPCDKLILESTFTSIKDMTKIMFGGLPVHYLVRTKFDSLTKITRLQIPLLILHGNQDQVVPFTLGERLFHAANAPKTFYTIDGADHNDTYEVGGKVYFERLRQFVYHRQES